MSEPHWRVALLVTRRCGLVDAGTLTRTSALAILSIVNSIIDGIAAVALVDILTSAGRVGAGGTLMDAALIRLGFSPTPATVVWAVFLMLTVRAVGFLLVGSIEGSLAAIMRRRIQERALSVLLAADWASLRDMRVGQRAGALTEEAAAVSKYLMGYVRGVEAVLSLVVLTVIAAGVSLEMLVVVGFAVVPIGIGLRWLLRVQARHSVSVTNARQRFGADVVEQLSGLMHIKASRTTDRGLATTARHQGPYTRHEIVLGRYAAVVGSFSFVLPVAVLGGFLLWTTISGRSVESVLPALAKVGTIGIRMAAGLLILASAAGNVSRLAGSLGPVREILVLPPERPRKPFEGRLAAVEVTDAVYQFENGASVGPFTAKFAPGTPLVVRGPSGSGKSTLANLVIGLYVPTSGRVSYHREGGGAASPTDTFVRAAYVTQDVQLFEGTVRENLDAPPSTSDEACWRVLDLVNASDFVRAMGGLEARITEGGRSVSGGQRRRLGIARALLNEPQLLILDEITSGLDEVSRAQVREAVDHAAKAAATLIITHEEEFQGVATYRLA